MGYTEPPRQTELCPPALTCISRTPNEVTGLAGWGSAAAKVLSNRILADQKSLARQGQADAVGSGRGHGKVKVYLTHYSATARRALITRYEKDIIVAPRSLPRPARDGRQNGGRSPGATSSPGRTARLPGRRRQQLR